jgi:GTP-binding protein EngB required for normal cell division/thiamine monophosphate synthase
VQLRALLRGRGALLLADRPDVAAAAEADGVLLSAGGLPTLLARRALPSSRLVLRALAADCADAAAAAADGADALVLPGGATAAAAAAAAAAAGSVPLLAAADFPHARLAELAAAGVRGALLTCLEADAVGAARAVGVAAAALAGTHPPDRAAAAAAAVSSPASAAPSDAALVLLASEREALGAVLDWLARCAPSLAEAALLEEALGGLGGPFLLVVAGEFNSGKSSVINALLGEPLLAEGFLPTTNEVTVLVGGGGPGAPRRTVFPDGHVQLTCGSALLGALSLVDTPGTNVILERQQRLAEEFVPRADLVLFVLSADRPLSESEARFLTYISRWEKRVAFALNKADLLPGPPAVAAVRAFVADNAARLLGAAVLPARLAPVPRLLELHTDRRRNHARRWHRGVRDWRAVGERGAHCA